MTIEMDNHAVSEVIAECIGEDHVEIMNHLSQPKYDEDIADELDLKATVVRTLLNDLHSEGLVEYERIKNKSTGWYTYIWRKRDEKLENYLKAYLEDRLQNLKEELEKKKGGKFRCSCSTVSMEVALENNFFCPKCGEKFEEYDNSKAIEELTSEIEKTETLYNKL